MKYWPPRVAEAPLIRGAHWRSGQMPLHKPVKAKVSEKSYQCKQEKHKLQCTKLNCPCPCHDDEREATRISRSAELVAGAGSQAATGGGSARRRPSGGASGASQRPAAGSDRRTSSRA